MFFHTVFKMTPQRVKAILGAMSQRAPWLDKYHNGRTVTDWDGLRDAVSRTPSRNTREILGKSEKVDKGKALKVHTRVVYLAPGSLSGINVCPWSSPGCVASCLKLHGRMNMGIQTRAQLEKTWWFLLFPQHFLTQLSKELRSHEERCKRSGMVCAVRINGTSDIPWERTGLLERHEGVTFYDYTKAPLKSRRTADNYSLTFSVSEKRGSLANARKYVERGHNAAVVVGDDKRTKTGAKRVQAEILERGELFGSSVVNGDATDVRFLDPRGTFVVLHAKGKAAKDTTGFVKRFA